MSNRYLEKIAELETLGEENKDPRLVRLGLPDYNVPRPTPEHPTKSHVVVAKEGDLIKTIHFGEQGAITAGPPVKGEPEILTKKREAFKARHRKNIEKGRMSAAWWSDRYKW